LKSGDLLLEKSGGGELQPVGAVVQYNQDTPAVCSNFVARMPVRAGNEARFLAYFHSHLYRGRVNQRSIKQTTGIQNLDSDSYLSEVVALPPLPEQRAIAAFLDRETARIDALIAKKQRLIELLQEKCAALISHAVTQGLNPAAPRKDSGIPWLGQIPAHWEVDRLRRRSQRVTDGSHISPDLSSEEFPFVSTVDIANGVIDFGGCLRTSNECYTYLVRTGCKPIKGDVLFSKDGTVGRTAVVNHELDFVVASSLVIITPRSAVLDSRFLNYWLNNNLLQQNVALQMAGSALRRISVEKVGRLPVVLPGIHEQCEIADHLDRRARVFDDLAEKVIAAMSKLQEYRASLIAHAVTGKIDVRHALPAELLEAA
jgi:type I restriction enzyme S subunit